MLTFSNVTFSYDEQHSFVLKQLSFTIHKGEYIAIVGANGSGKSSLIKLMNGLLLPLEGEVAVFGKSTKDPAKQQAIKLGIGFIFQNPDNQFVTTSIIDEVAFGLENNCIPQEEMLPRISAALQRVGLWQLRHVEPHSLSGGQKQRLAIACSLALRPKILILDEATAMLDPQGKQEVLTLIKELHQQGLTIIHVTHAMEEVLKAEKVILLDGAGTARVYLPQELFNEVETLAKAQLTTPFYLQLLTALQTGSQDLELREELQALLKQGQIKSEEDLVACLCKYL